MDYYKLSFALLFVIHANRSGDLGTFNRIYDVLVILTNFVMCTYKSKE